MIIPVLFLILAGSFAGAITLWLQDAPLWQVALGYVAGGWTGLLVGLPVLLAVQGVVRRWRTGSASPTARKRSGQHQQKTLP